MINIASRGLPNVLEVHETSSAVPVAFPSGLDILASCSDDKRRLSVRVANPFNKSIGAALNLLIGDLSVSAAQLHSDQRDRNVIVESLAASSPLSVHVDSIKTNVSVDVHGGLQWVFPPFSFTTFQVNLTITMNVSSSAGSARKPVIDQVLKADDEELAHREEAADSGHRPAGIGECVKIPEPIVISERPKVLFYEDFLSHEICDWMIATADPLMQPSDVTGGGADERGTRRSHAHSFSSLEQRAAPIREIKKRINNVTGLHTCTQVRWTYINCGCIRNNLVAVERCCCV